MESEIYYINMDGNIYFKVEDGVVCSQGKQTSVSPNISVCTDMAFVGII